MISRAKCSSNELSDDIDGHGEHVAGVYDEWYSDYDSHAIDALTDLARGGRALELGIGTGRMYAFLRLVELCGIAK